MRRLSARGVTGSEKSVTSSGKSVTFATKSVTACPQASREPLGGNANRQRVVDAVRRDSLQAARRPTLPDKAALVQSENLVAADNAAVHAGDLENARDTSL